MRTRQARRGRRQPGSAGPARNGGGERGGRPAGVEREGGGGDDQVADVGPRAGVAVRIVMPVKAI